jgi:endonuclease III
MAGSASLFFAGSKRKRASEQNALFLPRNREIPPHPVVLENTKSQGCADNPLVIDSDSELEEENLSSLAKSDTTTEIEGVHPIPTSIQSNLLGRSPERGELPPPTEPQASSQQIGNPFAQFAYKVSAEPSRPARSKFSWNLSTNNNGAENVSAAQATNNSKLLQLTSTVAEKKKKNCEFFPMKSIPEEEQDRIIRKWHSLADPSAPLEVRRYQVLLAARLHARCQEPAVRKAMDVLRDTFPDLAASTLAKIDPEILAQRITNLQYYNVKAKQIVKAAQEIEINYNGIVPEDETSLLKITGIGKVFADLLAVVNTRAAHGKITTRKCTENSTDSVLSVRVD